MPYEWLLFDADDTLFEFAPAEQSALIASFAEFDLPLDAKVFDIFHEVNLRLWKLFELGQIDIPTLGVQRFADLFARLNVNVEAEAFSKRYLYHLGQSTVEIPYANELLSALQGRFKLAVITNGISSVQRSRFTLSRLGKYFEQLFISEEIGFSKPAAGYFDHVFAALGRPPKEKVLVIGDSLSSDMPGGIRYGLDTCWFNVRGKTKPEDLPITYEIKDLRELIDIVKA